MNLYHPVIETAEPFLFPGEKAGILLVHGFTGTPKEMRTMGEFFAGHGYMTLGIRLPGHATTVEDMPHTHWQDWLCAVEDGFHLLSCFGKRVFIMGLSMGGILSLTAAARLPIAGAVAMSTPYNLPPDPRLAYIKYFAWLMPMAGKGPCDTKDPEMREAHVDYPANPTRSVIQLSALLTEMHSSLMRITCPVLLIHSRSDHEIPSDSMDLIYQHLNTQNKTKFWLEQSGHVVTRDLERQRVFDAALAFVERVLHTQDTEISHVA